MNLRLRGWAASLGLLLMASSAASARFVVRGALRDASPTWFICLSIGISGVPAAVGIGMIVNQQQLSIRVKRNVIAIVLLLVAIGGFTWLFWIVGEAGYNQTNHSQMSVPNNHLQFSPIADC